MPIPQAGQPKLILSGDGVIARVPIELIEGAAKVLLTPIQCRTSPASGAGRARDLKDSTLIAKAEREIP
jgi:hypothetical protein